MLSHLKMIINKDLNKQHAMSSLSLQIKYIYTAQ